MNFLRSPYRNMTDKEIVNLVIAGDNDAMLYLLYNKYMQDLKYYTWKYYNSMEYLDYLIGYLYERLQGKNGDWQTLKDFRWESTFRTWLCSVASHLFLEKKKELIGFGRMRNSIGLTKDGSVPEPEPEPDPLPRLKEENENFIEMLGAISRLKYDDQRFILIKELEGYNHSEIAQMLVEKRRREKKVTRYNNKIVVPDAHYVDMNKGRAIREIKVILQQL